MDTESPTRTPIKSTCFITKRFGILPVVAAISAAKVLQAIADVKARRVAPGRFVYTGAYTVGSHVTAFTGTWRYGTARKLRADIDRFVAGQGHPPTCI